MKEIKEILGAGNEFVDSAELVLKERITSPFYGYFIAAWFLVNWRLLYDAFFVDQQLLYLKTGMIRSEYLNMLFPHPLSLEFFIYSIIWPLFLTLCFFWIFPFGTRAFYRKGIKNQIALKVIELQEMRAEKKEENELVKEEVNLLKNELDKAKQEKRAAVESPELLWDREYKNLKNKGLYKAFEGVYKLIYKFEGVVIDRNSFNDRNIETEELAFAHTSGLVEYKPGSNNIVELTQKGKYFIKLYLQDSNKPNDVT